MLRVETKKVYFLDEKTDLNKFYADLKASDEKVIRVIEVEDEQKEEEPNS